MGIRKAALISAIFANIARLWRHLAVPGFIGYWHWRYDTDHHRLVDRSMSDDLIHEVSGTFLWVPCAYLVAAGDAFISVYASLVFYVALALRYVFSAKQDRHLTSLKQAPAESLLTGGGGAESVGAIVEPLVNPCQIEGTSAE